MLPSCTIQTSNFVSKFSITIPSSFVGSYDSDRQLVEPEDFSTIYEILAISLFREIHWKLTIWLGLTKTAFDVNFKQDFVHVRWSSRSKRQTSLRSERHDICCKWCERPSGHKAMSGGR